MKIDDFVKEAENYIKDQGWNIPVLVLNDVVRVGVNIPELLPLVIYKDYSISFIINIDTPERETSLLKRMKIELGILREKLKTMKETEKMTKEVDELLKG
jgi:hypothetical protein